ncbi:MAG TPA: recombinase RecA [candidate division Zixibacteria bacterium]|nr:recombinase RecA [candidate division Zixibacteria bacterium]
MAKKRDIPQHERTMDEVAEVIEKQFGKGYLIRLGDKAIQKVPVIPTGSISLDYALGIGGIPKGRITEIYGPEASGKTTLALHIIAEAQKQGGVAAFIDAEHALDPNYARVLGVDVDNLWVSQPDYGEQALEIAETLVRSGAVDIIVVDSVAALVPKDELEGNMGDQKVGLQARLMSQALRKLTAAVGRSNTALIFINQTRMKIGVMYGNPETTTGGVALKFYSSIRIEVRRGQAIKVADRTIGAHTFAKVVKNKLAPPFRTAEFDIIYGKGISREGEIIDFATKLGIMEKSGVWYSYKGEKIGQGREKAKEFLEQNPQIREEIEQAIREKLGLAGETSQSEETASEGSNSGPNE